MRVLFATASPRSYMAPPVLGDEQVNCGPEWVEERAADGRVRSLPTPRGHYDLAAVAARLPANQAPDLVVCLVDAGWLNVPRNLQAFRCPRILLVADTHHMVSPLTGMLQYARSEPFDRIVLLYDRHHVRAFQAAGVGNLFWLPGLTFPHSDAVVRGARRNGPRVRRIAFVGQAGSHHSRRRRLLETVAGAGLPLVQQMVAQAEGLGFYGASLLALNCSLNGDLNLRVFEILASGSALLTDRLVPESGLSRLLQDGHQMLTYASADELNERAAAALADPAGTMAIGGAGARWFDQNLSAARRRQAFLDIALNGTASPQFAIEPPAGARVWFGGDIARLAQALPVYEAVQETHRVQETVTVAMDATVPADIRELYATLPRVLVGAAPGTGADLAIFGQGQAVPVAASAVWCWDAADTDLPSLTAGLAQAGFTAVHPALPFFRRPPAPGVAQTAPVPGVASVSTARPVACGRRKDGLLLTARLALRIGDQALHAEAIAAAGRVP